MKRFGISVLVFGLLVLPASVAGGAVTIELAAEGGGSEAQATERNFKLVLPKRFFRVAGESGFSVPYIAELFYTLDGGGSWESAGLFKDLDKPFDFTAQTEGRYGFFVTLVDKQGRIDIIPSAGTDPQVTVIVDWTAPVLKLTSPAGGELIGAGGTVKIAYSVQDAFLAEGPITIDISTDGGQTWQALAEGLENTGSYDWFVGVGEGVEGSDGSVLVRLSVVDEVGHRSSDVAASPVVIDVTAPEAVITGPSLAASETVELQISSSDGDGTGVVQHRLWTSLDGGVTWSPAGAWRAGEAVEFSGTKGSYGLYAGAVDLAGNQSPSPLPGTRPQVMLRVDLAQPQVSLKTLDMGGSIAGGARLPIQWEAVAPEPSPRPVTIFISPDGGNSWEVVAGDLPNTGVYMWDVPTINSARCVLKITMRDASGRIGAAVSSKPFSIDSSRPTSAIGVAPNRLDEPTGDLSSVLRPLGRQKDDVDRPADEGSGAKGREQAPGRERPGAFDKNEVSNVPEPTPRVDEPWTGYREPPYEGPLGDDASLEDLMKAGFAAERAKRHTIAGEYYQRAADLGTGDPRPHAALGRVYAKAGGFNYTSKKQAFEAAIYEFEKALQLGGDEADIFNDMGWIFLESKRYTDAEGAFRKAAEIGKRAIYRCNLGIALKRQRRTGEAVEAFKKALELDADMKEAHFFLGGLYSAAGDWEASRLHWQKAVDGYGPQSRLGKMALSGLQTAREALGEVSTLPDKPTLREKMDRLR